MTQPAIITHGMAMVLGAVVWLLVSSWTNQTPASGSELSSIDSKTTIRSRSSHQPHRQTNRHLALLEELAHTAMESHHRKSIKQDILIEWVKHDPAGYLTHFNDKPLPQSTSFYNSPTEEAFNILAKTDPDFLLQYAKTHGCFSAISTLSTKGNPYTVLNLYLAQTENTISDDYFEAIFQSASEIDPEFYKNIIQLKNPEQQHAAFLGSSETLFRNGQFDAYFSTLQELQRPWPVDDLVENFSKNLITSKTDVQLIHSLPQELQAQAIQHTLESATGFNADYARSLLDTYIQNNWINSHIDLAKNVIVGNFFDEYKTDQWKSWALDLPERQQLKPLRDIAIRRWILGSPDQWRTIHELPTQELRDIAYTAVLSRIDLEKEAEFIPWIQTQIQNPQLQKAAKQAIIDATADPFDDDPFDGGDIYDPLNPIPTP